MHARLSQHEQIYSIGGGVRTRWRCAGAGRQSASALLRLQRWDWRPGTRLFDHTLEALLEVLPHLLAGRRHLDILLDAGLRLWENDRTSLRS